MAELVAVKVREPIDGGTLKNEVVKNVVKSIGTKKSDTHKTSMEEQQRNTGIRGRPPQPRVLPWHPHPVKFWWWSKSIIMSAMSPQENTIERKSLRTSPYLQCAKKWRALIWKFHLRAPWWLHR